MTAAAPSLGQDLGKLLSLLDSDKDSEALGAVRAIGRKLKATGKDWHWLAVKVAQVEPVSISASSRPKPTERWAAAATRAVERERRHAGWTTLKRSDQLAWLVAISGQPWLDSVDAELVAQVCKRLHEGMMFDLTVRQKRTLSGLIRTAQAMGLAP